MKSNLELLKENFIEFEKLILNGLYQVLPDKMDEVEQYISLCSRSIYEFHDTARELNMHDAFKQAIRSVSLLRQLSERLSGEIPENIIVQNAAEIGLDIFWAAYYAGSCAPTYSAASYQYQCEKMYPIAKRGVIHIEAGKKPRQDALGQVLEKIVAEYVAKHGKLPQYINVIHALERLAASGDPNIQEVDKEDEEVCWQRNSGKQETTSFKLLRDRLTVIRKKYSGSTG